ncbi:Ras-related protein Rab-21 [Histomonas meleagridis]|uniref:Ras-related protein Rab-21 n=1 Tax=Histomonas meleagridis TaxID=135588 RepID=UPI00355A9A90|nr:Ras-related protein Rab-21 [Histomonas meleagridis]KAH0806561.1 Ras-related protein Rab-21 [Histomonas meleagridis]
MAYKVVFLGEGRVGKTSIGKVWAEGSFDPHQKSTVAAAFYEKTVSINNKLIKIHLWDTAGQEEFHSLAPIYYKGSNAALLVYSVIDKRSFERTIQWRKELVASQGDDVKTIIVANKIDVVKDRCITEEQGKAFAASINSPYFEVSAKTGKGIDILFNALAEMLSKIPEPQARGRRPGRSLQVSDTEEAPTESKCC